MSATCAQDSSLDQNGDANVSGSSEEFGEDHGLADRGVPAGGQERQGPPVRQLGQVEQGGGLLTGRKLESIAAAELGEALRVVAVPAAQRGRRGDVAAPFVDPGPDCGNSSPW
jgi:hypothetical protein